MTHTHAKDQSTRGYSVQKLQWKQTDGRMDGQTDRRANGADYITYVANAVIKNHILQLCMI